MNGRRSAAAGACVSVALLGLGTTTASAATVDQITHDARDGRIDGGYSRADLEAALLSPLLKVYGGQEGVQAVRSALGVQSAAAGTSGDLPFTGAEMVTFAVLGSTLLVAGFVLRRPQRDND
jgi:hypothetical protein